MKSVKPAFYSLAFEFPCSTKNDENSRIRTNQERKFQISNTWYNYQKQKCITKDFKNTSDFSFEIQIVAHLAFAIRT